MKVKIISCREPLLWYKRHIGETFDVVREDLEYYWCLERNLAWKCMNIVHKMDCQIVNELKG